MIHLLAHVAWRFGARALVMDPDCRLCRRDIARSLQGRQIEDLAASVVMQASGNAYHRDCYGRRPGR